MAKGFTSPTPTSQMRHGKANRPKRSYETGTNLPKRDYPLTNSFASSSIPKVRPGDRPGYHHSLEKYRPKGDTSSKRGRGKQA